MPLHLTWFIGLLWSRSPCMLTPCLYAALWFWTQQTLIDGFGVYPSSGKAFSIPVCLTTAISCQQSIFIFILLLLLFNMKLSCQLNSLLVEINVTWKREWEWRSRCKCTDKTSCWSVCHSLRFICVFCTNIERRRFFKGTVFVQRQIWQLLVFERSDSLPFVFVFPFSLSLFISSLAHAACIPGTFKSKFGEGSCSPCPSNSRTSARGANICPCQSGFYRADSDPPDSDCTSKSSSTGQNQKVKEIKVKYQCWLESKVVSKTVVKFVIVRWTWPLMFVDFCACLLKEYWNLKQISMWDKSCLTFRELSASSFSVSLFCSTSVLVLSCCSRSIDLAAAGRCFQQKPA